MDIYIQMINNAESHNTPNYLKISKG